MDHYYVSADRCTWSAQDLISLPSRSYCAPALKLPEVLYDPIKTHSNSERDTAFNAFHQTKLSWWEWLEEPVVDQDGRDGSRPDLEMFSLAMQGAGQAQGPPLYVGEHAAVYYWCILLAPGP